MRGAVAVPFGPHMAAGPRPTLKTQHHRASGRTASRSRSFYALGAEGAGERPARDIGPTEAEPSQACFVSFRLPGVWPSATRGVASYHDGCDCAVLSRCSRAVRLPVGRPAAWGRCSASLMLFRPSGRKGRAGGAHQSLLVVFAHSPRTSPSHQIAKLWNFIGGVHVAILCPHGAHRQDCPNRPKS